MSRKAAAHAVWILAVWLLGSVPAWGGCGGGGFAPDSAWTGPIRSDTEVQAMVRGLLAGRTPPLDVGAIREVGQSYEVEVVTPGGSLVDRWLVDKASGQRRSLYGQMLLSFAPDVGAATVSWGGGGNNGWSLGTAAAGATGAGAVDPGAP